MYDYKARVVRWIDGDTVVLNVDQGFENWTIKHIRLIALYCPESDDPGGPEATARANELAPVDSWVWLDTRKAPVPLPIQRGQSFTRWLGSVVPDGKGESVSYTLVKEGLGTNKP
jgi:endonuclease YncB( thermonuclease family)